MERMIVGLDRPTRLAPPPAALKRPALFLDMDGVLAPIAPTPEAVGPEPERTRLLRALAVRLEGRLAVVSGRTLSEIDRICDGAVAFAAGLHGLERRGPNGLARVAPHPFLGQARAALAGFAAARPGVRIEDKGAAVALHFRLNPDAAREAEGLSRRLALETGLALQPGAMVFELKTPGADKGRALSAFMAEAPFAGARPVMVGDDLTDEDGFRAATILGGFGVHVGAPRPTAALYGLSDTDAVTDWLERLETTA